MLAWFIILWLVYAVIAGALTYEPPKKHWD